MPTTTCHQTLYLSLLIHICNENVVTISLETERMSLEDACHSLVEALDARRTDIVKTLLDHLRKSDTSSSGPSLETVLATRCTPQGTLLHYAVNNNLNDAIRALLLAGADTAISQSEHASTSSNSFGILHSK